MATNTSLDPASVGLTKDAITGTRTAVQTISEFAQASVSLVPEITGMPSWYTPIQTAISNAQKQSTNWLETLCPSVTFGVPIEIHTFSKSFATQISKIDTILSEIGSGAPNSEQKAAVLDALKSLEQDVAGYATKATATRGQLEDFNTKLLADVNALGSAVGTLEQHLADGSQYVQKLKQVYSESFVDVESHLSPCNVIVLLDMDISVKVSMTGAPLQAVAIVIAQTLVERVNQNVKQTQPALQVVLDSWGTLQSKLAAVLNDLDGATDDFASILAEFDLNAAETQWSELGNFVAQFVPGES